MKTNSSGISCLLLLALSALFLPVGGRAQENDKTLSPYFQIVSHDAENDQLPLKSTAADVNISGVIANVRVQQVYSNQGKTPIEAIYVFPSSTRAAVYSMNVRIGRRLLIAKIEEKNKARTDYNQARKQGRSATLLEQQRPNVFQMNVANIMPGDTVKVEMNYTELLVPNDGEYEFVYPTVVGPRYSNKKDASGGGANSNASSENWVANPYTHQNERPAYTFDLHLVLDAGMPIHEAKCRSHKTNILFDNEATAICQLDRKDLYAGNKDFIFQYRLSGAKVQTGLLLYEGKDENFFLAMIQPPKTVKPEQIPPREYIFILDVSGSMGGYPLDISKQMMKNLLLSLKPRDRFNILLFAGTSKLYAPASVEVTKESIEKGIQFTSEQGGGGGTELLSALKNALAIPSLEAYSRSFVLLTDGYVDVEPESFQLVGKNLDKANFFALGIGSTVNRFLIEGLCRVGKAEPFVVTSPNEASGVAAKLMEYIQTPVLAKIKTKFEGMEVYDVEPSTVPDAFSQRPILIYGKWRGKANGSLKLSGQTGASVYEHQLKFKDFPAQSSHIALQYLWARNKIQTISDYDGQYASASTQKEVCQLGLKYNLLTAYTSFIAIDSLIRNTSQEQTTVRQTLPLPENVSNQAIGGLASTHSSSSQGAGAEMQSQQDLSTEDLNVSYSSGDNTGGIEIEEKKEVVSMPQKEEVFFVVEEMPQYPGGEVELQKYIAANVVYPAAARENGIRGKVYVRFSVSANGDIDSVSVARPVDALLDAEAIRIVKSLPKWAPGKQQGVPVSVWYTVPINFQLAEDVDITIQPSYPGGEPALTEYLKNNLKYPAKARKKGIEGNVEVSFTVETTGELTGISISKAIHPLLDEEALRIVKRMPKWIPGKNNNVPSTMKAALTVSFKLETKK